MASCSLRFASVDSVSGNEEVGSLSITQMRGIQKSRWLCRRIMDINRTAYFHENNAERVGKMDR